METTTQKQQLSEQGGRGASELALGVVPQRTDAFDKRGTQAPITERESKTGKKYKVVFVPMNVEGTANEGESILDVAENCGVDLPHNCGGVCACSTCHVIIKQGMDKLTPKHEEEEDRLDMAENLTLDSRLGCQARIYGDIVVELPECTRKE